MDKVVFIMLVPKKWDGEDVLLPGTDMYLDLII
jgi:hypothetical protein